MNNITAGDASSASYSTLILKAVVAAPADGLDNITFGGLVGVNTKPLVLNGGKAARISFLNEAGKSGYTIGGAAGVYCGCGNRHCHRACGSTGFAG